MWPFLALEVARARRYGRDLSLLGLPFESVPQGPPVAGRITDLVVTSPKDRMYVVCLPETGAKAASVVAERLTGGPGTGAVAAFPADATTLAELVEAVRKALRRHDAKRQPSL